MRPRAPESTPLLIQVVSRRQQPALRHVVRCSCHQQASESTLIHTRNLSADDDEQPPKDRRRPVQLTADDSREGKPIGIVDLVSGGCRSEPSRTRRTPAHAPLGGLQLQSLQIHPQHRVGVLLCPVRPARPPCRSTTVRPEWSTCVVGTSPCPSSSPACCARPARIPPTVGVSPGDQPLSRPRARGRPRTDDRRVISGEAPVLGQVSTARGRVRT